MKLVSWNVNGIRAIQGKGFTHAVQEMDPDVLCMQEVKAEQNQVTLELRGYHAYWNSAVKKGYSGTAILAREKPLSVRNGIGEREHDQEGRVITLEYTEYFLVTVYVPNAQRGLGRLAYRTRWDADFSEYLCRLDAKKPVVFCGDLNVAHNEIDLARPNDNRGNPGFTDEERSGFSALLEKGFTDTFRSLYPQKGEYSWWSYMHDARNRDIGWRIDYVCTSTAFSDAVKDSFILKQYSGSDHCPVGALISL